VQINDDDDDEVARVVYRAVWHAHGRTALICVRWLRLHITFYFSVVACRCQGESEVEKTSYSIVQENLGRHTCCSLIATQY